MLKIKKVKPLFNRIITTTNKYEADVKENGVITMTKGTLKDYQEVIAVGDTVRNINVGDTVLINPKRYGYKKHQEGSLKDGIITDNPVISYNFNTVIIDGKECLLLYDSDIDYILEEYEEEEQKETVLLSQVHNFN